MRDNTPVTPVETTAIVRRVQALSLEARQHLLYTLLGRMLVADPEAVREEVELSERMSVGL